MRITKAIEAFIRREEGATAIEYCLIAAFVALVIVAGVTTVGTSLVPIFNVVAAGLS